MSTEKVLELFDNSDEYSLEDQLGLLADITQSFAFSLDIDETLQNALERFLEYLHAEADSIFLLENNDTELVCRGCAGPVDITGLRLPADAGIVGKTVTSRSCQIVKDVSKDPNFSQNVDKDTGFGRDNGFWSAGAGGNDRQATGHGFNQDDSEGFVVARQDQ